VLILLPAKRLPNSIACFSAIEPVPLPQERNCTLIWKLTNALGLRQAARESTRTADNTFASTIRKITRRKSIPPPGREEICCRNNRTSRRQVCLLSCWPTPLALPTFAVGARNYLVCSQHVALLLVHE
jgi:hypothetical protein